MFSIIIPTLNNFQYLKLCIDSIKKNSRYKNEIIVHSNVGTDKTLEYLNVNKIKFTHTIENSGICKGVNIAAKKATFDYLLYSHDDFYFCPDWDEILNNEVRKIGHNFFYLSGTMINNGQINFNCGNTIDEFDEKKFLLNYKKYNIYDFQGTTWAPHLIHKDVWNKVGGFSEEFFPGTGSDPDLNLKLWNLGIRIFKGINNFKVYHFGSVVTRRMKNNSKQITQSGNRGGKIFLLKWGMSIKFFTKFYLKGCVTFNNILICNKYNGPLNDPIKNLNFYFYLLLDKIKFIYYRFFYKINH